MNIDAHQHFWRLERGDYGWLAPELAILYRDYTPEDLAPLLKAAGIDGTILAQAAPTLAETEFMLGLAEQYEFIKGVVGWVDFESAEAPHEIDRLALNPKLVGLRPMIQDIPDDAWMLRSELAPGFEAMIQRDLTFDALVLPRHLKNLRLLLARHPELRVVIDHGAKPEIRHGGFQPWAADMAALAGETSAFCKISGLATEAGPDFTIADLRPYAAHLLKVFGPDRLIWGSDWPVCRLAVEYGDWLAMAEALLDLDEAGRAAVFGGNARRAYKLQ